MRAALIAQINLARSWLDERLLRTSDTGSGNPAYWTLNLGSLKALSDLEHAIAHITRLALSLGPPWCDYILTPTTILRLLPLRRRGSRAAVRTMGNCFGKPASPPSGDNFSTPGRVLHSTGAAQQTSSIPASHTASRSQGRTLGSSAADSSGDSPKAAAARAAEERAKAAQGKGKLGRQLDAQKARTQADTLAQASRENRAARDADQLAETRAYA